MSTILSITTELQKIVSDANETTGGSATNVRDGVDALIGGFDTLDALIGDGEITASGGSGSGGGSLDGLENGWDVMFYDENGDGLAFYSIKQGHSIEAPVYTCKNWQDADGEVIVFPYTPTGDAVFYANNSTLASQLYDFYGVDSGVYPYLVIQAVTGTGRVDIAFGKTINTNSTSMLRVDSVKQGNAKFTISDYTDLETFVSSIMQNITSLSTGDYMALMTSGDTYYQYTNFECAFTSVNKYRLDQ